MANMIQTGMQWKADTMSAYCSDPVTYSRGSYSVVVNAVIGSTDRETLDQAGNTIIVTQRDFTIVAAVLQLNGSLITPCRGDRITEASGEVFEVLPSSAGEDHYRPSDASGISWRIHTKKAKA